jgi:RsiW-degrading membrane proteinase PrsW (M82 family)
VDGSTHLYLAASGMLPALVAMCIVDRIDRKRPEPASLRRKVALVGALSVIPVIVIAVLLSSVLGPMASRDGTYAGAAYDAFVTAAGIEELCKIGAIYWVFSRVEFDERLDGIVYASRAGLGFALVENVVYLLDQKELGGLLVTWVLRALMAIPGHALWTGMMGYFVARRRFDHAGPGIVGGYLLAVLLHGGYNFAVFAGAPLVASGRGEWAIALLGGPVLVILISLAIMRRMARTALHLDDVDAARRQSLTPPGAAFGAPGTSGANVV